MPFGKVAKAIGTTKRVIADVYGHHSPEHLGGVIKIVSGRRR